MHSIDNLNQFGNLPIESTVRPVVYTAVFGDYDRVAPVPSEWPCDFICFTDNPSLSIAGWKTVCVSANGETPARANRRYKILPHLYLSECEKSLYVDANIRIKSDPSPLFKKYLTSGVIAIPRHLERESVFAEAQNCIDRKLVDRNKTERQMARYRIDGLPSKHQLTENGVMFRNHLDGNIKAAMTTWWQEYCNGADRDQLSLPYVSWKHNLAISDIDEGPRKSVEYFRIDLHNRDKEKSSFRRLAVSINNRKHFSTLYSSLAKLINLAVTVRDRIMNRFNIP